jgi:hypothetical protein
MDIETKFNDLGVDAITGIQLMKTLNINSDDFYDESRFMRFKDIIDYFKNVPDRDYLLGMITIGKPVDRLDHVWGYTKLQIQKNAIKSTLEAENKKFDLLKDSNDEIEIKAQENKINEQKVELMKVDRQISIYEL